MMIGITRTSNILRAKRRMTSGVTRLFAGIICAGIMFGQASAVNAVENPTFKRAEAELISLSAASSFYGGATTHTDGLAQFSVDPDQRRREIVELARALDHSVDLIYEYVRNRVEVTFLYGLQKGAIGASEDEHGTPFDQANLMVELLRESGYSASYKIGSITLTGAQFQAWTGVIDAKAACQLLANGGIPAEISAVGQSGFSTLADCSYSGGLNQVRIAHIWVQVTIDGADYVFDPSYKPHTFKSGIDIAAAAGFSGSSVRTAAASGMTSGAQNGVSYIKSPNADAMAGQLDQYAVNLVAYLRQNHPDADLEDIAGGQDINPEAIPPGGLRQQTLPYPATVDQTWSGDVPDQYRTKLSTFVRHWSGVPSNYGERIFFEHEFFVDEIYARRLWIEPNYILAAFDLRLKLDEEVLDEFNPDLGSTELDEFDRDNATLKLTVDHPYAAAAGGGAGSYMDEVTSMQFNLLAPSAILQGWGFTNPDFFEKLNRNQNWDPEIRPTMILIGGGEPATETFNPQFMAEQLKSRLAASWLGQFSHMAALQAEMFDVVHQHHHSIGIVSDGAVPFVPQATAGSVFVTLIEQTARLNVATSISLSARSPGTVDTDSVFQSISAAAATLEGSVVEQLTDSPDTVSTARRFAWASSSAPVLFPPNRTWGLPTHRPYRIYWIDSTNLANIDGLLFTYQSSDPFNYFSSESIEVEAARLKAFVTSYVNEGYSIAVIETDYLGPGIRRGAVRGSALIAVDLSNGKVAHLVTDGWFFLKGSGGGPSPDDFKAVDPNVSAEILKDGFKDRSQFAGVALNSGALNFVANPDIFVGSGEFPYRLDFQRSFTAGSGHSPGLPNGWTHNWDIRAELSGSGLEGMGISSPLNAAGSLIAFLAARDIYLNEGDPLKRQVTGVLAYDWWLKHLSYNVVTIVRGKDTETHVRLPDGTFNSPKGRASSVVQTGEREIVFRPIPPSDYEQNFREYKYENISFDWTGVDRDTIHFQGWRKRVADYTGAPFKHGFTPVSWTFPSGVVLTLTNDGEGRITRVQNNLGRALDFTYDYQASHAKLLMSIADGTGRSAGLAYGDYRGVITQQLGEPAYDSAGFALSHVTLPDSSVENYEYRTSDDTGITAGTTYTPYFHLYRIFSREDAAKPVAQFNYGRDWRVSEYRSATAAQDVSGEAYKFYVHAGYRGERVDPLGGAYTVYYDELNRAVRFIDESGGVVRAAYDAHDRVTERVFPEGNRSEFKYDARNNPIQLKRYPKPGSPEPVIVAEADYDPIWNKIIELRGPFEEGATSIERVFNLTYGPATGNLLTFTQPEVADGANGGQMTRPVWTLTYNAKGQLLTQTDPTGMVVRHTYNATGDLTATVTNSTGAAPQCPPTGADTVNNLTTCFGYDAVGNVTTAWDADGNQYNTQFDLMRRKIRIDGPEASTLKSTFNLDGQLIREETATGDPNNPWAVTAYTYTPSGKVETVTDPDGNITFTQYDALDRPSVVTDPELRMTKTVYDAVGRPAKVIRAYGTPQQQDYQTYTFSPNGKPLTVADANGNVTSYGYDGHDRLVATIFPDGNPNLAPGQDFETYAYDVADNLVQKRTRAGQIINFTFDALNRQTVKTGVVVDDVTTSYDLAGRVTSASSASGRNLTNTYDPAGRVITVTDQVARTVAYQYDAMGNRIRVDWPDGYFVTYGFDGLNRIISVTETSESGSTSSDILVRDSGGSYTADYQYYSDCSFFCMSWVVELSTSTTAWHSLYVNNPPAGYQDNGWKDGFYETGSGQEVKKSVGGGGGSGTLLATFGYDAQSRTTSLTYGNGTSVSFGYEPDSDLKELIHTFSSGGWALAGGGMGIEYGYAYTPAHQLKTQTANAPAMQFKPSSTQSIAYAVNSLNQYTNVTTDGAPAAIGYDANGNLTGDGVNTFTYDAENRLLSAAMGGGTIVSYAYDPLGRRASKTVDNVMTEYLYDGDHAIVELDGPGNVLRRYVHGPGTDRPIAMVEGDAGSGYSHRYYHTDRLGSVVALTDDTGAPVTHYTYDAYGVPYLVDPATGAQTQVTAGQPYLFTGRRFDFETNLYYNRARYYSAILGRFLQTDPVGYDDQMNLYAYVGNDPVNMWDPSGKDAFIIEFPDDAHKFGHKGVGLIDEDTGEATYMDYGPYDSAGQSKIKQQTSGGSKVRVYKGKVEIDPDTGRPTPESFKKFVHEVMGFVDHGRGLIKTAEVAYFPDADNLDRAFKAANNVKAALAHNKDRYNVIWWNCEQFAHGIAYFAGARAPGIPSGQAGIPRFGMEKLQRDSGGRELNGRYKLPSHSRFLDKK